MAPSLFRYFVMAPFGASVISLFCLRYFVMAPLIFCYGAYVMSPRNTEKTKWHKSATIDVNYIKSCSCSTESASCTLDYMHDAAGDLALKSIPKDVEGWNFEMNKVLVFSVWLPASHLD